MTFENEQVEEGAYRVVNDPLDGDEYSQGGHGDSCDGHVSIATRRGERKRKELKLVAAVVRGTSGKEVKLRRSFCG